MQLSARNQIRGHITNVRMGTVMAEIEIDIGAATPLVAAITLGSAESMQLAAGDQVLAVIKSTEVIVAK